MGENMNIIKTALLKNGDTIGILAPSGAMVNDTNLKRGISFFEKRGFKVKLADNIFHIVWVQYFHQHTAQLRSLYICNFPSQIFL